MPLIELARAGPLAVLTFDRPPLNLWDDELSAALSSAVDELTARPPRGLLIRAEGRVFTAGVDVRAFCGLDQRTGSAMAAGLLEHIARIGALPYPTVLAAHALCLTWGFELALACDLLVAAEGAQFALVERTVGLSPFMGGTQRLASRAGPARAKELVFTGARYDAATLAGWGVVNRVLPREGFDLAAQAFAADLAEGPTVAHAMTKRLADLACSAGLEAADAATSELAGDLFATSDAAGAIEAFLRDGPGHATFSGQ